jgi:hypothetical protein
MLLNFLLLWRWRQQVSQKCRYPSTRLHSVTFRWPWSQFLMQLSGLLITMIHPLMCLRGNLYAVVDYEFSRHIFWIYGETKLTDSLKMADIKYSFSIFPNMKQRCRGSMNDHQEVLNSWNRVGRQHFTVIWRVHGESQRGQTTYHYYLISPWDSVEYNQFNLPTFTLFWSMESFSGVIHLTAKRYDGESVNRSQMDVKQL